MSTTLTTSSLEAPSLKEPTMTNRPVSHAHEDRAADELREALRPVDPIDALTVSNFSKALFAVIALGVGLGCLFAALPGA